MKQLPAPHTQKLLPSVIKMHSGKQSTKWPEVHFHMSIMHSQWEALSSFSNSPFIMIAIMIVIIKEPFSQPEQAAEAPRAM